MPAAAFAAAATTTASGIQQQIDDHNAQIAQLKAQIAQYQSELDATTEQKQTLQSALDQLDLSRRKISAQVSVAQNQISATQLEITQLGGTIDDTQASIETENEGLAQSLRALNESDREPLALMVFGADSLSDIWEDADAIAQFEDHLQAQIQTLAANKADLEDAKAKSEAKQQQLIAAKNDLTDQEHALDVNRSQQAALLAQTKDKESNYQQLIAQKKAAEAQFEDELTDLESKLQYTLNPATIPTRGTAVLSWPLDHIRVTQYFGDTDFSRTGAYDGKGHNGVDFAAAIGTPVYAAADGVVADTGNTDKGGCYSYGKWILLQYPDGLSSIYGHLSEIDVAPGQAVADGQRIGYSGFTGYATGPHLHFGLFVTDAVKVMNLGTWYAQEGADDTTPCAKAGVSIPVAPLNGYLNPLDYLPKLS
ncbi:MAG TPA: peptidoglycan DD-metalloendopeptidase family protein [Candidatus Paceibacterota bacterium]|nr:peptidoglycan DD-metalloendopeptidase family protein [Candidatus Paceibacterota bacterium]